MNSRHWVFLKKCSLGIQIGSPEWEWTTPNFIGMGLLLQASSAHVGPGTDLMCQPLIPWHKIFNSANYVMEKEMTTHCSIVAWKIPWQRRLVGYSPRVAESDMTAWAHLCKVNYVFVSTICCFGWASCKRAEPVSYLYVSPEPGNIPINFISNWEGNNETRSNHLHITRSWQDIHLNLPVTVELNTYLLGYATGKAAYSLPRVWDFLGMFEKGSVSIACEKFNLTLANIDVFLPTFMTPAQAACQRDAPGSGHLSSADYCESHTFPSLRCSHQPSPG